MKKINTFFFFQKHIIPLLIILCISFPFIVFFVKVWNISFPEYSRFFRVFSFTVIQSLLSLALSWAIALPAAVGLLNYAKRPYYFIFEWLYLLPFLLPVIVPIGGIMNILESFTRFPFGLLPIVLCHGLIYGGAVAVILARLMMAKCSFLCDWAFVHGIPRMHLLRAMLQFSLKRDIQLISLTVFCFCFTSFSAPVLLGGQESKTIEVFIYEHLRNPDGWPLALGLLLFEILFVFILSYFISQPVSPLKKLKSISYFNFKQGIVAGILPCLIIFFGLLEGLFYLDDIVQLDQIIPAILSTLFLFIGVGMVTMLFLILISFCPSINYLKKFLIGYAAPSVVLTGFAFLIFFDDLVYFSWVSGLAILFLPALYRWTGDSLLKSLQTQVHVAQTLGANLWLIFKKIIWPQCFHHFLLLSAVAGFWASGDFAFTMITSQGETNLAILAQQLLSQYRLEQGVAVICLLLFIGSLCFVFFGILPFLFRNHWQSNEKLEQENFQKQGMGSI